MENILQNLNKHLKKKSILIYLLGFTSGIGLTMYFSEVLFKKFVEKSEFIKKLIQK